MIYLPTNPTYPPSAPQLLRHTFIRFQVCMFGDERLLVRLVVGRLFLAGMLARGEDEEKRRRMIMRRMRRRETDDDNEEDEEKRDGG